MIRDPHCQLQVLPEAATPLSITDRLRLLMLRCLQAAERRLGRHFPPAGMSLSDNQSGGSMPLSTHGHEIAEGDLVEVLSLEEIRVTLDASGRYKGLEFMPGMEVFCGHRLRVKKKVRAIFDERAWRMLSIKNCFLLEGAACEGLGMYDKEGCDRCCYYFWKDGWLRKIKE